MKYRVNSYIGIISLTQNGGMHGSLKIEYESVTRDMSEKFDIAMRASFPCCFNAFYLDWLMQWTEHNFQEVVIILIDVDSFKRVVIKYGHVVATDIMESVATSVAKRVYDFGVVVHRGGDELIFIMHKNLLSHISKVDCTIKECVSHVYAYTFKLSVSTGVAVGNLNNNLLLRAELSLR